MLRCPYLRMGRVMHTDWANHFREISKRGKVRADIGAEPASVIMQVQQKLNSLGFANPLLVVDGAQGPLSTAAIKAFQQSKGLTVDGKIGPQTLSAMGLSSSSSSAVSTLVPVSQPAISGLRQSVVNAFTPFTTKFEGYTPYMYTDVKGLVTTGIGNLIDNGSPGPALTLPWKRADGSAASQAEIQAAWYAVKNAWPDVQSVASQSLTSLRLDSSGIAQVVRSKLEQNHDFLRTKFPGYVNWPADAQLGLHSMAWAMGPGFNFPAFMAAVNQPTPDFVTAASQSHMNAAGNPGLVPRNTATNELFTNAANVLAKKANPDTLFWPSQDIVVATVGGFALGMVLGGIGFGIFEWKHYKDTGKLWPL